MYYDEIPTMSRTACASHDIPQVMYYDEILTMSARMCILTGDTGWARRHSDYTGPITNANNNVEKVENILLDTFDTGHDEASVGNIAREYVRRSSQADANLVELEDAAKAVCGWKDSTVPGQLAS